MIALLLILGAIWLSRRSLNPDSKLATNLYSYLGTNDVNVCGGLNNYADELVSSEDLSEDLKICSAYTRVSENDITTMKIDKSKKNNTCSINNDIVFATDNYEDDICTVTKIDAKKINDEYKTIYGSDIKENQKFQYNSTTVCYYSEDAYYCGLGESYTYTIGAEPHTYRSIKQVKKSSNKIIIYDYFLKIVNDECYGSFTTDKTIDKCNDEYNSNKMDYKFLKKYGTLYKHTYQKNGKNYYWVSSEPVD